MKEILAPAVRVKGFTDSWKQCKLGEMVNFSKGTGYSKSDLKESGTPIILYGRLYTKYETIISDVDTFVDEKPNSVFSEGGEVIVPASGETAEDISVASVVDQSGVLLGGDLNIVKPPLNLDSSFLAISISNGKPHHDMANMAQGKSVVHLHNSDLAKIDFPYPRYEEQCRISQYFKSIDHIITLHQRKLDQLKKLKKYFLQNMFPAKGEKVPRIRFKGFTGDWEQRKLVDIATMHARIGWQNLRTSEFLDDGDYYLITGTDFKDGRIDFSNCHYVAKERYDQDKNIQIHNGSILITKDGTLGKVAYISGLNKPATLNAGVFNVVIKANDVDEKYLYHYLAGPFLMDYVSKRATGGTIKHLNQNILVDFPVVLPSYDEQKKIGETLQDLDNLITLHQRKLNQLLTMKKFMLQNLFI